MKRLESVVKKFPIAVSCAQSRARDKSAKLLPTTRDAHFSAGAQDSGMLRDTIGVLAAFRFALKASTYVEVKSNPTLPCMKYDSVLILRVSLATIKSSRLDLFFIFYKLNKFHLFSKPII